MKQLKPKDTFGTLEDFYRHRNVLRNTHQIDSLGRKCCDTESSFVSGIARNKKCADSEVVYQDGKN